MSVKTKFFTGILVFSFFVTIIVLYTIWVFVKPKLEGSFASATVDALKRVHEYTANVLDESILKMVNTTALLSDRISQLPKEGEIVLGSTLSLYSEIVQIRVYSKTVSDELEAHNAQYSELNMSLLDTIWTQAKVDSSVQLAWGKEEKGSLFVFTKRNFTIQNIPFEIFIVWHCTKIGKLFREMPLGENFDSFILGPNYIILSRQTENIDQKLISSIKRDSSITFADGESYISISNAFKAVDLKMITIVQTKEINGFVDKLFMLLSWIIVVSMLILSVGTIIIFLCVSRRMQELKENKKIAEKEVSETVSITELQNDKIGADI